MGGTETETSEEVETTTTEAETEAPESLVVDDASEETSNAPEEEPAESTDSLTATVKSDEAEETEGAEDISEDESASLFADISLPEGVELDVTALETFEPLLKGLKMSSEQAQSFADAYLGMQESRFEAANQQIEAERKQHIEQLKDDPDFGGDNFQPNLKHVALAIGNDEGQELAQVMQDYGLDNHPAFIKYLASMGRNLREDAIIGGGSRAASAVRGLDALFPTTAGE